MQTLNELDARIQRLTERQQVVPTKARTRQIRRLRLERVRECIAELMREEKRETSE